MTNEPRPGGAGSGRARGYDPVARQVADQPAAGAGWREPITGVGLVFVPPGRFLMGSSQMEGERGFDPEAAFDEMPAHEVDVTQGFWMAEHPVTNATYAEFLSAKGRKAPPCWQDPRFKAKEQPVVGVSFEDALAFTAWLTEQAGPGEGRRFDLPSEAEWEYAARGSDGRKYPWGDAPATASLARFGLPLDTGGPSPVGGRPEGKSPFGCQDMAGNVQEWCLDAWRVNYHSELGNQGNKRMTPYRDVYDKNDRRVIPVVDPCHPGDHASHRVVRGGSWFGRARNLRCAYRSGDHPGHRSEFLGFRVVCRGSRPHVWHIGS